MVINEHLRNITSNVIHLSCRIITILKYTIQKLNLLSAKVRIIEQFDLSPEQGTSFNISISPLPAKLLLHSASGNRKSAIELLN